MPMTLAELLALLPDNSTGDISPADMRTVTTELYTQGVAGAMLVTRSYNPGTDANVSTTSTTPADVDATNLVVTFTAPSSGNVLVDLTAVVACGGSSTQLAWNLRFGSTDVAGTIAEVSFQIAEVRVTSRHSVIGLTPGTSYTYKWGHARTLGSAAAATHYGADRGAAVMVVWAAP